MKKKLLTICAATFLFVACNNEKTEGETSSTKDSADKKTEKMDDGAKKEQAWIPIDSAAAMNAMMEAGKITEEHKMLAKSNGNWSADVTMWEGADKPAMKSSGTQMTTSILGGHFQQSKFSGNMMGMPFEGVSTIGYDNTSKQYVSTWIENMSSSMMIMTGAWDNASNMLKMSGKLKNPANGIECTMRETLQVVDDNTHVLTMYGPDPQTGKEYKMMEIKYARKK